METRTAARTHLETSNEVLDGLPGRPPLHERHDQLQKTREAGIHLRRFVRCEQSALELRSVFTKQRIFELAQPRLDLRQLHEAVVPELADLRPRNADGGARGVQDTCSLLLLNQHHILGPNQTKLPS